MAAVVLLRNSLLISLAGVAIGLAANAFSPNGLSLSRDYFVNETKAVATQATQPAIVMSSPGQLSRADAPPLRSKRGLPLATHEQVVAWFRDPAYKEQRILFVDARSDDAYAKGHIAGAYQFDHYHPERHIANVLPASQLAQRIVVYCTGGECEDSELAVLDLVSLGIPESKLVIYGGGIAEWTRNNLPVQATGRRP